MQTQYSEKPQVVKVMLMSMWDISKRHPYLEEHKVYKMFESVRNNNVEFIKSNLSLIQALYKEEEDFKSFLDEFLKKKEVIQNVVKRTRVGTFVYDQLREEVIEGYAVDKLSQDEERALQDLVDIILEGRYYNAYSSYVFNVIRLQKGGKLNEFLSMPALSANSINNLVIRNVNIPRQEIKEISYNQQGTSLLIQNRKIGLITLAVGVLFLIRIMMLF